MRSYHVLFVALLSLSVVHRAVGQTRSYTLYRVGTIISRAPLGPPQVAAPAMLVIDDTTFSRSPCGHATRFGFTADIQVVHEDGTPADTSNLVVGRSVSVFISNDSTAIVDTCPDLTRAAKVVLH
jgi:hypothetical protein